MREPRRRAGAARAAIDRAVTVKDGIAPIRPIALGRIGPEDMAHPADRGVERVDRLDRGADGLANPRAEREDATRTEIIETAIAALRLDDGVEIAAISDIDRQRADAVEIDPDAARRDTGRHVGQPERGETGRAHV